MEAARLGDQRKYTGFCNQLVFRVGVNCCELPPLAPTFFFRIRHWCRVLLGLLPELATDLRDGFGFPLQKPDHGFRFGVNGGVRGGASILFPENDDDSEAI